MLWRYQCLIAVLGISWNFFVIGYDCPTLGDHPTNLCNTSATLPSPRTSSATKSMLKHQALQSLTTQNLASHKTLCISVEGETPVPGLPWTKFQGVPKLKSKENLTQRCCVWWWSLARCWELLPSTLQNYRFQIQQAQAPHGCAACPCGTAIPESWSSRSLKFSEFKQVGQVRTHSRTITHNLTRHKELIHHH